MSDRQSFIQAIIANREDDLPRLVYADWLEERGESERAEFIRLQCALAKARPHDPRQHTGMDGNFQWRSDDAFKDGCHRCVLERRESDSYLLNEIVDWAIAESGGWLTGDNWQRSDDNGELAGVVWVGDKHWVWHRGFITEITCTAEDWLLHADAITAATPLERVTLTTEPRVDVLLETRLDTNEVVFGLHNSSGRMQVVLQYDKYHQLGLEGIRQAALKENWPNIEFTLPTQQPPYYPHGSSNQELSVRFVDSAFAEAQG